MGQGGKIMNKRTFLKTLASLLILLRHPCFFYTVPYIMNTSASGCFITKVKTKPNLQEHQGFHNHEQFI